MSTPGRAAGCAPASQNPAIPGRRPSAAAAGGGRPGVHGARHAEHRGSGDPGADD
ncbi:hypothetical protein O4J56_16980 [Nocardiopsis sp. RSe5-2]|uniref:Uncharacterized protein n=1 Tax=Nocardiopsis endophytica TaxID=3018445 RepID=A0ABT4U5V7_9ACTN|nr:hypothetical protein [Nocardiopsis endophytica]